MKEPIVPTDFSGYVRKVHDSYIGFLDGCLITGQEASHEDARKGVEVVFRDSESIKSNIRILESRLNWTKANFWDLKQRKDNIDRLEALIKKLRKLLEEQCQPPQ